MRVPAVFARFALLLCISAVLSFSCANTAASSDTKDATEGSIKLSALDVSSGTLSPAFSPDVTDYTVAVANDVASIKVTFTTADSQAGYAISPIQPMDLTEGENVAYLSVISRNYSYSSPDPSLINHYTVTITRAAQ